MPHHGASSPHRTCMSLHSLWGLTAKVLERKNSQPCCLHRLAPLRMGGTTRVTTNGQAVWGPREAAYQSVTAGGGTSFSRSSHPLQHEGGESSRDSFVSMAWDLFKPKHPASPGKASLVSWGRCRLGECTTTQTLLHTGLFKQHERISPCGSAETNLTKRKQV